MPCFGHPPPAIPRASVNPNMPGLTPYSRIVTSSWSRETQALRQSNLKSGGRLCHLLRPPFPIRRYPRSSRMIRPPLAWISRFGHVHRSTNSSRASYRWHLSAEPRVGIPVSVRRKGGGYTAGPGAGDTELPARKGLRLASRLGVSSMHNTGSSFFTAGLGSDCR